MKKIRKDVQECMKHDSEGQPLGILAHNGGFDCSVDDTSAFRAHRPSRRLSALMMLQDDEEAVADDQEDEGEADDSASKDVVRSIQFSSAPSNAVQPRQPAGAQHPG